jgi:hypothetical protein
VYWSITRFKKWRLSNAHVFYYAHISIFCEPYPSKDPKNDSKILKITFKKRFYKSQFTRDALRENIWIMPTVERTEQGVCYELRIKSPRIMHDCIIASTYCPAAATSAYSYPSDVAFIAL